MGGVHASKYGQMPDVSVTVFDVDPARAQALADRAGATVATSLEALVSEVDAVDVCLPTPLHVEVGLTALRAGKPTLMEKPMARTLAECRELVRASEETGTMLMPAQVVRYFPEFRRAHEIIVEGGIGTPASVRLRRGGGPPKGGDWYRDLAASGGILFDLAVHDFDWLRWTVGPVTRVVARSARRGKQVDGAEFIGEVALTTLEFANGCVGHVENTWLDPGGFRVTIEASGPGGAVEYDSRANPSLRANLPDGTRTENNYAPQDDPYYRQLRAFLEAVASGSPPPVSAREGAEAVAIALAAIESADTMRPAVPEPV
jgi:predicted dehydrogenase